VLAATLALVLVVSTSQAAGLLTDSTELWETGSYPFRTGTAVALDTARDLAFVGAGSGVFVVDVSDPSQPVVISDRIRCGTLVKDMFLDGSRLYLALLSFHGRPERPRDVEIWDVSVPTSPLRLAGIDLYLGAQCVYARGDTLLVGSWRNLFTYDISNMANPVRLDSVEEELYPEQIEVRDTLAFISVSVGGVSVYDVRLLAHPLPLARWGTSGSYPGISVIGNRLYFASAAQPLGSQSGLRIYDISDPLHGQLLGAFDTLQTGAYRVAVKDTVAFVTYAFADYGGLSALKAVSVAIPENPRQISSYGQLCTGVTLDGDLAYVAFKNRLEILGVSDPAHPVRIGAVPLGFAGRDVAVSQGMAYSVGGRLTVLDARSGRDLAIVSAIDLEGFGTALAQSGSLALVGVSLDTGGSCVDVIDVANPHSPERLSSVPFDGQPRAVAVVGSRAYVGTDSGLAVLDITDPRDPIRVGALARAVGGKQLLWRDSLLFGSDLGHLIVVDVSDVGAPTVILDTAMDIRGIALRDTFLYVLRPSACVFSTADPVHLRLLSTFWPGAAASAVALGDSILALCDVSSLVVHSIAVPESPVRLGSAWLSDEVSGLAVVGETVYTSLVTRHQLVRSPYGIELDPVGGFSAQPLHVWPSMVRYVLNLAGRNEAVLFDESGRRVLRLRSGANDVRALAPGVYFVRPELSAVSREPSAITKVVLAR
jgi:hypothetical protein